MAFFKDTIFALSSGALPSGVAVVRLSGPAALTIAAALTSGGLPEPRDAALKTIRARNDNTVIDRGLMIVFPSPASFTGEDCVEFHLHGGRAVVQRLLAELGSFDNARHAEAGEFSRRAFENGKADLVEMEGLADLIVAETEMQRRLAMEQSFGGLSQLYEGWAKRLTHCRAMIEAELDFVDEDDIPNSVSDTIWNELAKLTGEMRDHVRASEQGEIVRNGLKVVISGPPNSGKSSLMNALAGSDLAIVTDIAGTTRDILHADVDMNGFLVRLYDTAGLRETDDKVENEGIRRALNAIQTANIVLQLEEIGSHTHHSPVMQSAKRIRIGTKVDRSSNPVEGDRYDVLISTLTGQGLDQLKEFLVKDLADMAGHGLVLPVRGRQVAGLKAAIHHLDAAVEHIDLGLDLRSEFLRSASQDLGKITGRVDVEHLLDVIFSEFCIGK